MSEMNQEKILPIVVGAALKSLRNTDFDVQTAICEVIDNSLQARAKEIKIKIAYAENVSRQKNRPTEIAFGDDGEGMNNKDLQFCLKLGYSGRYDDRDGIGRFGVGMTFAAISLCQKIEVYSRPKQGSWFYTYLDISDIDMNNEPGISPIEQKDLPEEYKDLVGDFGTLVVWSMIDRIDAPVKEDEMIHNLGRIYRKFIGQKIIKNGKVVKNENQRRIYLNNQIIHSHDPLFVTKSSKFPDDETAVIDDETSFRWSVHEVDAPAQGQKQGTITIRTSLLPESWRQIRAKVGRAGSGRSKDNIRRRVDDNEGISILRHGREVAYKPIPHLFSKDREIDRFWSCEIDFEPVLDHWFSVRNIKIGARPLLDLKNNLKDKITPSVSRFRDQIGKTMNEYDAKQNESMQGPIYGNEQKESELGQVTSTPQTTTTENEQFTNIQQIAKESFYDKKSQEEYENKVSNPDNKYNIIEISTMRPDSPFIEIMPNLTTKVMHYNMSHAFFRYMYETINRLKEQIKSNDKETEDTLQTVDELRGYFDNLFFAYSEAYYDLNDLERQQKVKETLEELMVKWNYHLRKIYKNM